MEIVPGEVPAGKNSRDNHAPARFCPKHFNMQLRRLPVFLSIFIFFKSPASFFKFIAMRNERTANWVLIGLKKISASNIGKRVSDEKTLDFQVDNFFN